MTDSQLLKETAKFLEQIASRGGPLSGNAMEHARRLHELCAVSETAATDRNAIIEECARTAENTPTVLEPTGTFFSERCAKAIRSLKTAGASAPSATAAPVKRWCTISYVHQPHDGCDGTPAPAGDTPRTDAYIKEHTKYGGGFEAKPQTVPIDFARQLERELAEVYQALHNEKALEFEQFRRAERYRRELEAARSATGASVGWRLMPPEPTREMLDAWHQKYLGVYTHRPSLSWHGLHYSDSDARLVESYQALLETSPQAPSNPCCGEYATCLRACTPRGKWLAEQEEERPAVDMLRVILPMAKGYALAHRVGNNLAMIEEAEEMIRSADRRSAS